MTSLIVTFWRDTTSHCRKQRTAALFVLLVLVANPVKGDNECNEWCQRLNTRMQINADSSVYAHVCGYPKLASELQAATLTYLYQQIEPDQFAAATQKFTDVVLFLMDWQSKTGRPPKKAMCATMVKAARNDLRTTNELISR